MSKFPLQLPHSALLSVSYEFLQEFATRLKVDSPLAREEEGGAVKGQQEGCLKLVVAHVGELGSNNSSFCTTTIHLTKTATNEIHWRHGG